MRVADGRADDDDDAFVSLNQNELLPMVSMVQHEDVAIVLLIMESSCDLL